MLERFTAYLQHQDFCSSGNNSTPSWPPPSAVTVVLGRQGQSCAEVCWSRGLSLDKTLVRDSVLVVVVLFPRV